VYKELDAILVDFEDYMACARLGGTNSATLDAKSKNADEDIRATVVQNVSIFFRNFDIFCF
jgi:hypothetical protein